MTRPRLSRSLPLLLLLAACVDDPTAAVRQPEPKRAPRVVGIYEVTLTGIGSSSARASVASVDGTISRSLVPLGSGLTLESLSTATATASTRSQGGHRYIEAKFRVRNMTGGPLSNLTLIPAMGVNPATISGTPFVSLLQSNGSPVDPAIAPRIVPAGAVTLSDQGTLRSTQTDVLQVFEESEIAAITLPAQITGIFPYGFVVRNARTPDSRTLPATGDPNDFSGVVTFGFRYPLQPTAGADPFSISLLFLAVEDTETRLTESIEEGQDSSAVRQVRERAAALGATTVTVLAGSTAADAAVTDYPGQRQICSVRTAGTAGSPTTTITAPGAYALIRVYRPGESADACGAYFRGGTATPAAYNMPYALTLRAMDLYGNIKTTQVDTVRLESVTGPSVTLPASAALVSGVRSLTVSYSDYGTSLLRAVGRRNRGLESVSVMGITRTWTGSVDTDWGTGGNWNVGVAPGSLDSIYIPASRPVYPLLTSNVAIGGVTVDDGATVNLGSFDLTSSGNATAGTIGGITSTTGRLVLTGASATLQGTLPRLRVTGGYTLSGDVTATARVTVDRGRLRISTFRLLTTSF